MPVGGINSRSGGSGVVPPNLLDERKIPKFYQDAIVLCGANGANQFPNTALVYNLMVTSQLPRQVLGNIWSLVNRTLPGRLTRQEFYACLALIALAQKGESLSALCDVTSLPIPFLNSFKINEISTGDKVKGVNANGKRVRKNIFKSVIPQFSTSTSTVQYNDRGSSAANCKQSTSIDYSSPFDDIGDSNDNYLFTDILSANNSHPSSANDGISLLSGKSKLSEEAMLERMLVWTDCLRQGIHVFTEAIELLYKSNDSAREVFTTKRGFEYFQCLTSVNCVMKRVRASAASLTKISGAIKQDTADDSLTVQCGFAEEKWDILKQLLERNVDDSNTYWDQIDDNGPSKATVTMKCGVCVQPITARWESTNFVARNYHSSCANFYLNRVGTLLPQLC